MEQVLFCGGCGAFRQLTSSNNSTLLCDHCNEETDLDALCLKMVDRVDTIQIERSQLLHQLSATTEFKQGNDEAIIDEECPKCSFGQLSFHTAQLRGVDEGQTIFYTCLNKQCAHKFTVNS